MQYCLLMHYQEGPEIGLTEEDMAPARAAFARYADDLDAAGVLIGTQVLQSAAASTTSPRAAALPRFRTARSPTPRSAWAGYSSSMSPTWMPHWHGPSAARPSTGDPSRSVPSRSPTPAAKAGTPLSEAQTRVAELVGASYGRLLALLAARSGDIAA